MGLTALREKDPVSPAARRCEERRDRRVAELTVGPGGHNGSGVAAEILEALAPVLSKDRKLPMPAKDRG